jgi:hypothetical protein
VVQAGQAVVVLVMERLLLAAELQDKETLAELGVMVVLIMVVVVVVVLVVLVLMELSLQVVMVE